MGIPISIRVYVEYNHLHLGLVQAQRLDVNMLQQILSNGIFKSLQKTNDFSLFMLVCLLSAILFSYPALLNLPPQTLHLWRQSDCLAFALNYYDGQKFFEPRVYNYLNDNGLCAGECPLIYYAVGKIWQFTGV